jgi:hypothetical protein
VAFDGLPLVDKVSIDKRLAKQPDWRANPLD